QLQQNQFPLANVLPSHSFYRARKVTNHDILEINEMLNAPVGKSTEGRFNHSGQSHLYLANTKETAIKEVVQNLKNSLIWVQEFKINSGIDNILDLTFDITNISLNDSPL
ncbi:RES family NAD+ phosphorylase, partial [Brucella sp. 21LCYQ03]|nr:RES family NAD+ phosphorylase [Brucella sp. 21LCYQ03]